MDPDQTARTEAWYGSSIFVEKAPKTFQQTPKADNF